MNDGGSELGGSQSASGGSGVSFLNNPKDSKSPPGSKPSSPVRVHILGQEISGVVDTPVAKAPAEPLLDETRPVLDLSSILDENQPSSPAAAQPQQSVPSSETESASIPLAETLPSDDSKKTSKTTIIAAIIAVVVVLLVAIIAVVVYFVTRPVELTPAELAFNTYANNLVYGTPSAESIEKLPSADQFYYHQKLSSDSEIDQTYLDELSQEFDAFYNLLSPDLPVYASASNYQQLLNFLKLDPSGDRYSQETLTTKYLDGGESSVSSYIKRTIATLPETNPYASEFRALKQNEFAATLDYLLFLDDAGCIDSATRTIDDYCANTLDQSMQNDPEQYFYHDITGDETASYFQDDAEDPEVSEDPDDSSDSSLIYRTPYTVMYNNADLAKNLLNTDYNLLGENLSTLKNSLYSSK